MTQLHRDLVLHNPDGLVQQGLELDLVRQPDGTYTGTVKANSDAIAASLEILSFVAAVGRRFYALLDRAHTESKANEQVEDLRNKEKAVAEQYWVYREQGMAHRVAIDCTHQISDTVHQMNWSKADIGYCVRNYPADYFKPNLKEVSK